MSDVEDVGRSFEQLDINGAANFTNNTIITMSDVEDVGRSFEQLDINGENDACCKGRECLAKISQDAREKCCQEASKEGVLYVSQYIRPHQEGPPDTRQYFIYSVPVENKKSAVVCQKAFKEIFGISQYTLQQAQGAALKRTKGASNDSKQGLEAVGYQDSPDSSSGLRSKGKLQKRSAIPKVVRSIGKAIASPFKHSTEVIDLKFHDKHTDTKIKTTEFKHFVVNSTENTSRCKQTPKWSESESFTFTNTFEWHWENDLAVSADTQFKTGIPYIAEGKIQFGMVDTFHIGKNRGSANSKTKTWTLDLPVTAASMTRTSARAIVLKHEIHVPFTASIKKGSKCKQENGTFRSVQYETKVTYTDEEMHMCLDDKAGPL